MKRTIAIRIKITRLDKQALLELRNAYVDPCNRISPIAAVRYASLYGAAYLRG